MTTQSVDPRTGSPFGDPVPDTSPEQLDAVAGRAQGAAAGWGATSGSARAEVLRAVADALDARAADLVPLADRETSLGEVRLTGELARTTFQLRMFAELVESGGHVRAVLDPAVAGPPPAGHPELRRVSVPVGPVAVFGASNFPFAFSVPGGDTAAALAAGCPVVVKAHPGHPQTSELAASTMVEALSAAGAPDGTLGLVRGLDAGSRLVQHPAIRAAAFTGSYRGGRALFDLAVGRPDPIPFYGELGSVNPVVVTPAAAARGAALAAEYVDSLTLGTGQFCTNPGLVLLPKESGLTALVVEAASDREPGVMLHEDIARSFRQTAARLGALDGVRVLLDRSADDGPGFRAGPVLLGLDSHLAAGRLDLLHTECFGPAAVLVEYEDEGDLLRLLELLDGCLVGTVHADESEPVAAAVVERLTRIAGRVVWNGWPTGVAVSAGQQHGGPHPATTSALTTSVGTAAVERFLRPVAFQSVPPRLLPTALRE